MFSKISNYGNQFAEGCCLILLVAMTLVTFAQVFFRFVIVHSLPWSEEFSRYALVWASFLGASIALKRGLHIGVEAFVTKLSREKRRWIYLLTLMIIILFLLTVIVKGVEMAFFNMKQSSPAMRIPMGFPYLAIPAGSLLMFIHLLNELILGWKRKGGLVGMEKAEEEKRMEAGF
ncbi:MAG: TRAP transporter small permease [Deltaproteobacteria bacterium]|nr:TRAP transporter small permease [Deltaproteobacteria bacterium]MBM4324754.1 TRAP transporter small permease [Deltaproteobacteria bacterium]